MVATLIATARWTAGEPLLRAALSGGGQRNDDLVRVGRVGDPHLQALVVRPDGGSVMCLSGISKTTPAGPRFSTAGSKVVAIAALRK